MRSAENIHIENKIGCSALISLCVRLKWRRFFRSFQFFNSDFIDIERVLNFITFNRVCFKNTKALFRTYLIVFNLYDVSFFNPTLTTLRDVEDFIDFNFSLKISKQF